MMWKAAALSTILGFLAGPAAAQIVDVVVDPKEIPKQQSWGFRRIGAVGGGTNALVNPAGLDPGVRTGSPTAGGQLSGLSSDEVNFANAGINLFAGAWSVTGTVLGEPFPGLGPYYNTLACGSCHAYPALGGSGPIPNNEVGAATLDGA